jgi:hypothetical protein
VAEDIALAPALAGATQPAMRDVMRFAELYPTVPLRAVVNTLMAVHQELGDTANGEGRVAVFNRLAEDRLGLLRARHDADSGQDVGRTGI